MAQLPAAIVIAASLAACNGGAASPPSLGSTGITAPAAAQRAALQSALLAVQFQASRAKSQGEDFVLSRRRVAARRTALDVPCTNGFTEKDTYPMGQTTHVVQSVFYDAGCTQAREVVTSDEASSGHLGMMFNANGVAWLYDRSRNVVDYQTITYSDFMGDLLLQTTDARTSGGTPFAGATISCYDTGPTFTRVCAAAGTVAGQGFDTGAAVGFTFMPPAGSGTYSLNVTPYAGGPGTLGLDTHDYFAPAVTGGTPLPALVGTMTLTVAFRPPYDISTLSLSLSGGGEQITGSLANGVTTLQDGSATVKLDLNGNGSINYANGFVEQVIHYRDVG